MGWVVTRGYSIGNQYLVAVRGYLGGGAPPTPTSGGSWLVLARRRFRR